MKRNRLPNREKLLVYNTLVTFLSGCNLSHDDVLLVIEFGNPSMYQRVCRWVAADPLYRKIGINMESFKRAVGLWIAYKAGVRAASLSECSNLGEFPEPDEV